MRRFLRIGAVAVLASQLVIVGPATQVALATDVVCTINNGGINGSDSQSGYPGTDAPGADGSYSVNNAWHDSWDYEYCQPSADWFKEKYLNWSQTAYNTRLSPESANRTIQVEQNVFPADSYNYTGGHDSDLPYGGSMYTADIAEQTQQGFEEVSFIVWYPNQIKPAYNYHAYLQWEQEADGGFLDFSPLLNRVVVKIEWGDNWLNVQNYDEIGIWSKKVTNNK